MIKSFAHIEQQVYSDGKKVEDKDIKMKYDGEKIAIDVRENGHKKHMVLSNDDIMKVFSQPMHDTNLMARLKMDFKKKTNKTKSKTRKNKTKKSKTRKSHSRS
jgi:hypothetical protein